MASPWKDSDSLAILTKNKPKLRDRHDAIAFLLHSDLIRRGCSLIGLSENDNSTKSIGENPTDWNKSEEAYTFKYLHSSAKDPFIVKMLRMDNQLLVHAAKKDDQKVYSMTVNCDDYVDAKASLSEYSKVYKDLNGLMSLFASSIGDKLALPKEKETSKSKEDQREDLREDLRSEEEKLKDFWGGVYVPPVARRPPSGFPSPGGDFDRDLDPFGGGGGNLYGPGNFPFGIGGPSPLGPGGLPRPGTGPMPRGPRFDPLGPFGGIGRDPDPDHARLPRSGRRGGGGDPDII